MNRKVIQITTTPGHLVALCDDGTMWTKCWHPTASTQWEEYPSIPAGGRTPPKTPPCPECGSLIDNGQCLNGHTTEPPPERGIDDNVSKF